MQLTYIFGPGPGAQPRRARRLGPARLRLCAAGAAVLGACAPAPVAPAAPACGAGRAAVVASQRDVARLAGCAALDGLVIRTGAALDLAPLSALTVVTGAVVIGPTVALETIALGGLRAVTGALRVAGNGLLQGLYLPALVEAGDVVIDGNAAISTIALPRLVAVRGDLRITSDPALEVLDLPALRSIDRDLLISGVPALTLVDAPQLERAAAVEISAPKLPPEALRRLQAATPPR